MNSFRISSALLTHAKTPHDAFDFAYPAITSRFDESLPRQVSLRHFLAFLASVLALHGMGYYSYTHFEHVSSPYPLTKEVEIEFVKTEPESPQPPAPPRIAHPVTPPPQLRTPQADQKQNVPQIQEPSPVAPVVAAPPAPEPVTEPTAFASHLHNPTQHYPQIAVRLGWEGTVLLHVHVLASGKPDRVDLIRSSGHQVLDNEAIHTVSNWTFAPARRGNTPIDGWVTQPIDFKLTK